MRKNAITINGVVFELFRTGKERSEGPFHSGAQPDAIYGVYGRPSVRKVNIWNWWCNWCHECMSQGMECKLWISSYNTSCFSIMGRVRIDGDEYALWITRDHNRAYQRV